jgi:hypothetical protein
MCCRRSLLRNTEAGPKCKENQESGMDAHIATCWYKYYMTGKRLTLTYSSASGSMEMFFSPFARFSQYFFTQAS